MTTTMPCQKDIIDVLQIMGLRNKFKVIVGGGAGDVGMGEEDHGGWLCRNSTRCCGTCKRVVERKTFINWDGHLKARSTIHELLRIEDGCSRNPL